MKNILVLSVIFNLAYNINSKSFAADSALSLKTSTKDRILLDCPSEYTVGQILHFKILQNSSSQIYQSVQIAGDSNPKIKLLNNSALGKSFSLNFNTPRYNSPTIARWKYINHEFEVSVYDNTIPPAQMTEQSVLNCTGPIMDKWKQ